MVANLTEFNQNNVRGHFTPGEWRMWRRAGDALTDMAAFWGGSDKVLLVPAGVDRRWLGDLAAQMRWDIDVVEPTPRTGRLLEDTLQDQECMARLVALLPGPAKLEAWGATPAVAPLASALRAAGVPLEVPLPAADAQWSVAYLDGKLALDDLARWVPELTVPRSYTATTFDQLLGLVRAMVAQGRPFVAKSNVGVGGFGTFAVPDPTSESVEELIEAIDDEPVFREGPYLVQEWVRAVPAALRPTYDGIVTVTGDVETVGVGGMLIDGCTYRGVAVGDLPLADAVIARVMRVGEAVGRAAAALGYVGWYDVDFVLSDDGELYATEINARRTSPTHAFTVLERWRQLNPSVRCVICDDHLPVHAKGAASWQSVREAFEGLQDGSARCLATIVRTLAHDEPGVGVAIGAGDYETGLAAREQLAERLRHGHVDAAPARQVAATAVT